MKAGSCFDREANLLADAKPYLTWDSPWGADEERRKEVAPILIEAAEHYEKGIEHLEKFLDYINK